MLDFKDAIGYLYLIREKTREKDTAGLFEYYCPKIKATENEIASWEDKFQLKLPEQYCRFLLSANGWNCVSQDINLLGIEDLTVLKTNKYVEARDFCVDNLKNTGNTDLLLPIAVSNYTSDLFLMILDEKCDFYGQVIWVAGEEIERYNNFEDYFLSLIEYNKYNYELITGMKYAD